MVRASGTDVERLSEVERGNTSLGADGDGTPRPSSPKQPTQAERGNAKSAPARDGGGHAESAAKRSTVAEHGCARSAAPRDVVRRTASAPKRATQDEHAHVDDAQSIRGAAASAPGRCRGAEHACGQPRAAHGRGGRAASLAKPQGRAYGGGRDAGVGGVLDRATCAAGPQFEAGPRNGSRVPVRGARRFSTSAAKRLAYAAGHDASALAERSPALERHLAALSCFGAPPGSRSRYVPVAVKRERRDQGRCSYVDRHSGRRCGSRYRLEIDHILPFALGGGAEPGNLRLLCEAWDYVK